MNEYKINFPFPKSDFNEITIISEDLYYSEIGGKHSGVQVTNLENNDLIHEKCKVIADLIRDIQKLNKV